MGESKNCGLDIFKMVFEIKYSSNLCQYLEAFFTLVMSFTISNGVIIFLEWPI